MSAKAETLDCVCARAAYALTNAATWATMSTKMMILSAGSTPDRCRLETLLILSRPFFAPLAVALVTLVTSHLPGKSRQVQSNGKKLWFTHGSQTNQVKSSRVGESSPADETHR